MNIVINGGKVQQTRRSESSLHHVSRERDKLLKHSWTTSHLIVCCLSPPKWVTSLRCVHVPLRVTFACLRVVICQDKVHCASNLLGVRNAGLKWLSCPEDQSGRMEAELALQQPSCIKSVSVRECSLLDELRVIYLHSHQHFNFV